MDKRTIYELFKKHGITDLTASDVWAVQGNPVVKHATLERLGAALKIQWEAPRFLRTERDECVVIVSGSIIREGVAIIEWSTGEAAIGQNYQVSGKQAAYPYAMAEKRAKDRVIIKLAGLYGAYSSDEMSGQDKDAEEAEKLPPLSQEAKATMGKSAPAAGASPQPTAAPSAGVSGGEPSEPDMERLLRDIEREPANTDGSLIKMARVLQSYDTLEDIERFLAAKNVREARKGFSPGQSSLFLRFLEDRRRLVGAATPPVSMAEPETTVHDASRRKSLAEMMPDLQLELKRANTVEEVDELTDEWLQANFPEKDAAATWEGFNQVQKKLVREEERHRKLQIDPKWKEAK